MPTSALSCSIKLSALPFTAFHAKTIEVEVDVGGVKMPEDHFPPLACPMLPSAKAVLQPTNAATVDSQIPAVARTIADLDGVLQLESKRIAEKIQYRTLDRTFWA
ncbi:MAG TPA: hypothetical protein VN946_22025 [Terriglobales bacterium]|nr:hypothetical protein [Terriglobales bacterium]